MKSLLITGGTGELGQAMLARLTRDYRCVVLYHSEESWQRFTRERRDVEGIADPARFDGPLYGIVHLAGGFIAGSHPEDFTKMLEMNLMSAVRTIEALRDRIDDGGRIIAISSIASLTRPAGLAAYAAAKSALNAYIDVLAKELRPRRITANALLPSALATPSTRASMGNEPLVPLEQVAETAAFLLRDAAASISGQLLTLQS